MTKRMLKTLENTCFANSPVISVAAKPGGPDAPEVNAEGVETLIEVCLTHLHICKFFLSFSCGFSNCL